ERVHHRTPHAPSQAPHRDRGLRRHRPGRVPAGAHHPDRRHGGERQDHLRGAVPRLRRGAGGDGGVRHLRGKPPRAHAQPGRLRVGRGSVAARGEVGLRGRLAGRGGHRGGGRLRPGSPPGPRHPCRARDGGPARVDRLGQRPLLPPSRPRAAARRALPGNAHAARHGRHHPDHLRAHGRLRRGVALRDRGVRGRQRGAAAQHAAGRAAAAHGGDPQVPRHGPSARRVSLHHRLRARGGGAAALRHGAHAALLHRAHLQRGGGAGRDAGRRVLPRQRDPPFRRHGGGEDAHRHPLHRRRAQGGGPHAALRLRGEPRAADPQRERVGSGLRGDGEQGVAQDHPRVSARHAHRGPPAAHALGDRRVPAQPGGGGLAFGAGADLVAAVVPRVHPGAHLHAQAPRDGGDAHLHLHQHLGRALGDGEAHLHPHRHHHPASLRGVVRRAEARPAGAQDARLAPRRQHPRVHHRRHGDAPGRPLQHHGRHPQRQRHPPRRRRRRRARGGM
ncbi:MAG: Circadian clock protein KaiC, partial [uncultured Gemmatimonadetes bacterium]